jgi:hypothetical protein
MDNDYPVDVAEILRVIGSAEVIVFRFAILSQRLLIDPRSDDHDGPLIKLVPPARSAEERFRSLRQLRPRFKLPERIIAIQWPKFVTRLEASGVWGGIEQRMLAAGAAQTPQALEEVLDELRRLERREVRNAISGEGYETMWER